MSSASPSRLKRATVFAVNSFFKLLLAALIFYTYFHVSLVVGTAINYGNYVPLLFIVTTAILLCFGSLYVDAHRRERAERERVEAQETSDSSESTPV